MDQADTIRVQVALQYKTRSWQTIDVDLGPAKLDNIDLIAPRVHGPAELGIPVVSPVRCLKLADQVAQKLHACTGPFSAARARDILDILLIDMLGELNYSETGTTVRRVFEERATQDFPPNTSGVRNWRPWRETLTSRLEQYPTYNSASVNL